MPAEGQIDDDQVEGAFGPGRGVGLKLPLASNPAPTRTRHCVAAGGYERFPAYRADDPHVTDNGDVLRRVQLPWSQELIDQGPSGG